MAVAGFVEQQVWRNIIARSFVELEQGFYWNEFVWHGLAPLYNSKVGDFCFYRNPLSKSVQQTVHFRTLINHADCSMPCGQRLSKIGTGVERMVYPAIRVSGRLSPKLILYV